MRKKRTPRQNRRYKLHEVIKSVLSLKSLEREILTTEQEIRNLSKRQGEALAELRDKFGYNVQLTIK